ncbi:AAA family ATPase [[Eubacterium] cellulosolvens]
MFVLGLIGMPGSGKGECANQARETGITVINMGDLIRERAMDLNLELNDENIGSLAHTEREKFGYNIWAKRTLERINELNLEKNDLIIIDGIRGDAEVLVFREAFGERFHTVAIKMSDEKRFELLKHRNREDAPESMEEFMVRDERESKWGIRNALEDADYVLFNTGTLGDLKNSFINLLDFIRDQEFS